MPRYQNDYQAVPTTRESHVYSNLTDLGIDTSAVVQKDDVGNINQILASDADDASEDHEGSRRGLGAAAADQR